jgi:crotonobetainyl-CoA:carnitine CoA-transferase CaiB-like acyl-CoA transferase
MLESLGEWMGNPYYYARYGGAEPPRAGASHATIAPYGPVATASGEIVNVGLQNEREWQTFCARVLQRPELAADPRLTGNVARVAHRTELDKIIAEIFAGISLQEAQRRLDDAGIASARQRTMTEFAAHPQLAARNRFREVDTPGGPVQRCCRRSPRNGTARWVPFPSPANTPPRCWRGWRSPQTNPTRTEETTHERPAAVQDAHRRLVRGRCVRSHVQIPESLHRAGLGRDPRWRPR